MRQLDFYEFTGIFLPGVVTGFGFCLLVPLLRNGVVGKDMSLGGFSLFAALAYALGHLVQAVGNVIERLWWKLWGGMSTDWVRTGRHRLLSAEQGEALACQLAGRLCLPNLRALADIGAGEWYSVTRQVYAAVAAAGRSARIDTFNGNYGLNRGLAAALLVLLIGLGALGPPNWPAITILLLLCFGLAIARMHQFGRHYARELFVQFLQLPSTGKATAA